MTRPKARLSRTQRLVRAVTPARRFAAIEAESRRWHLICPACGWSISTWDAGGIRYKAASRGKRVPGRCPGCGTAQLFRVERIED